MPLSSSPTVHRRQRGSFLLTSSRRFFDCVAYFFIEVDSYLQYSIASSVGERQKKGILVVVERGWPTRVARPRQ